MEPENTTHITGVVLAGGGSQRMGTDKARLLFGGRDMLAHMVGVLKEVTPEIVISVREKGGIEPGNIPVVEDYFKGYGPLAGIHAAMEFVKQERMLVISCDLPLMKTALLKLLCDRSKGLDITVAESGTGVEPLVGVYSRRCLDRIRSWLENGRMKVVDLLEEPALRTKLIRWDEIKRIDPSGAAFLNVNRPADYRKVLSIYSAGPPTE